MGRANDDQGLLCHSKITFDFREPTSISFTDELGIDIGKLLETLQEQPVQLLFTAGGPSPHELFKFRLELIQLLQCLQQRFILILGRQAVEQIDLKFVRIEDEHIHLCSLWFSTAGSVNT